MAILPVHKLNPFNKILMGNWVIFCIYNLTFIYLHIENLIQKNGLLIESPPSRPPRNKPLPLTADIPVHIEQYCIIESLNILYQEKANISRQTEHEDEYSNSGTFHDALNNDLSVSSSDQEDEFIEDLEFDEEQETQKNLHS